MNSIKIVKSIVEKYNFFVNKIDVLRNFINLSDFAEIWVVMGKRP